MVRSLELSGSISDGILFFLNLVLKGESNDIKFCFEIVLGMSNHTFRQWLVESSKERQYVFFHGSEFILFNKILKEMLLQHDSCF